MTVTLILLCHLATYWSAATAAGLGDGTKTNESNAQIEPPKYNAAVDNGTYGYYPVWLYATADDISSPRTNFLQWSDICDDGQLYFITPRGWTIPEPGPMILDRHGELIWTRHFDNEFGGQAYDFTLQQYQGQDYLTFWLGDDRVRGHGSGSYYMLNSSYDIVHEVGAANGLSADLHEFLITPEGTALMTMYQIIPQDLSDFRDFDPENPDDQDPHYIWDCVFQEVTVDTQELVFEWRASEHLNINETFHGIGSGGTKSEPFDWFHINSIDKDELGNYLTSARYMHSITYVDGKTGDIIWTLGGRRNNFMDLSDGFAINFAWQHDARFLPLDTFPNMYSPPVQRQGYETKLLTLFDNAAEDEHYEYGMVYSRGLLLEVTYPTAGTREWEEQVQGVGVSKELDAKYYSDPDLNNRKVREINGTNPDYTVKVIKSYANPHRVRSSSQGSMQILPQDGGDPKVLVGYGLNALWTEFEADGTVLCDVHFGAITSWERGDIQSYRVYKFAWTGQPETWPKVVISDDDSEIYVSWNGATDVVEWILQCSDTDSKSEQDWSDLARVTKSSFETSIALPEGVGDVRYLRVIALGTAGRRLKYGISKTIDRDALVHDSRTLNSVGLKNTVGSMSPLKVFLIMISAVSGALTLSKGYRRYLSWKPGSPGVGPLKWRKGPTYKLSGDA